MVAAAENISQEAMRKTFSRASESPWRAIKCVLESHTLLPIKHRYSRYQGTMATAYRSPTEGNELNTLSWLAFRSVTEGLWVAESWVGACQRHMINLSRSLILQMWYIERQGWGPDNTVHKRSFQVYNWLSNFINVVSIHCQQHQGKPQWVAACTTRTDNGKCRPIQAVIHRVDNTHQEYKVCNLKGKEKIRKGTPPST